MTEPVSADTPASDEQKVADTLLQLRVEPDLVEHYGTHPVQFIEWYGPEDGKRVVFIHGGHFREDLGVAIARPAALGLAEAGYRVALVEYRRIPGDPEKTFADAMAIAARPDLAGATWVGHSAGAALALNVLLSEDTSVTHVVGLAPLFDMKRDVRERAVAGGYETVNFMGGTPDEVPDRYARFDQMTQYERLGAARFAELGLKLDIIHGGADETVPVARTRDLMSEPFNIAIVPDTNHNDLIRPGHDAWLLLLGAIG